MAKDAKTLIDNTSADERYDAGLLRMLKTTPNLRNEKKTGRRKAGAAKRRTQMALPEGGGTTPDTK
jgi:hypothetical protein